MSLGGAFQMSQGKNKNCSELLLTNGMGLDRAPIEILIFIFSPLQVKPPNQHARLLTKFAICAVFVQYVQFLCVKFSDLKLR